jgi:hypothetical protein
MARIAVDMFTLWTHAELEPAGRTNLAAIGTILPSFGK